MSLVEGDGRVDLLFKGNDIYINDFSKAIFDVIQIESSDEGILCRFRLSYNSIELGVTFDKINNNVNEVLTRAYISSSVTDYGDEYSLDLNFSMRIEMTFIYIPKTRKEYDDDYGDLMNMSIQKCLLLKDNIV
ncbi:hypothetical protein B4916_12030 [Yersinia intermedia]|nr:hypothetical protein B4916_12030 [Yersinia intermedia]